MNWSVGVIIPCRNAAPWLTRCLDSVTAQSLPADIIHVVDDGSEDGSASLANDHPCGAQVHLTRGAGGAEARNIGIRRCETTWIAFLDADDAWLPDHLRQAQALLTSSQAVGYMSHRQLIDIQGRIIETPDPFPAIAEPRSDLDHLRFIDLFAANSAFHMSSTLVRRDRLLEVGLLDPRQTRRHDIDMWLRVIAGRSWAWHPLASSLYQTDTPGSISSALADRETWFLRALLKNEPAYAGHLTPLIAAAARRAISYAIRFGDREDREQARVAGWSRISPRTRLALRLASLCPPAYRTFSRLRERIRGLS